MEFEKEFWVQEVGMAQSGFFGEQPVELSKTKAAGYSHACQIATNLKQKNPEHGVFVFIRFERKPDATVS